MNKLKCNLCPHNCNLSENQVGFCKARKNENGKIISINYGLITSIALDPIEKKPLNFFHQGSKILSVGSFGCNMHCLFCQNHEISMNDLSKISAKKVMPDELVNLALAQIPHGNIGIAYTYNEPLISFEYVLDCAKLARTHNLKNVLVTNSCFNKEPLTEILPFIDALNIDLKAFTNEFYHKMGGDLETVKSAIKLASKYCHIEITTLIVPDENDSENEIDQLSKWISSINHNIPLHLSRFFPRYKMSDKNPTDINQMNRLYEVAKKNLAHVILGNI